MKITKSRLKEIIYEELQEISGVAGSGVSIEKLRAALKAAQLKAATAKTKAHT